MKFYLGVDGKPKNSPFHVDLSLNDFDGDKADYLDYLNELYKEWAEVAKTLRPNEPNPKSYALGESDPQYQSALRIWEGVSVHEQVAYRTRPKVQPEAMPLPYQVMNRGTADDKARLSERMNFQKVIMDQREKAARARALGHAKEAHEFEDRAVSFNRTLERMEKENPFSFIEHDKKQSVEWGKVEIEKLLKMKPAEIEQNLSYVTSLLEGYRTMSDEQESYVLDTGSPYSRAEHQGLSVKKVSHPGISAKDLSAITGETDNQGLLDHAFRCGWIQQSIEDKTEEPPATEETSMAQYDKYVQRENAKAAENAKDMGPSVVSGMFGG